MYTHAALHHLDCALGISAQELAALNTGDVEAAALLAEQRESAIASAWAAREGCDTAAYSAKLHILHSAQERIHTVGRALFEDMRSSLVQSRKESKRLAGYKKAVSYALQ